MFDQINSDGILNNGQKLELFKLVMKQAISEFNRYQNSNEIQEIVMKFINIQQNDSELMKMIIDDLIKAMCDKTEDDNQDIS